MNPLRERVKEHFPTVLLTLLSIVQALALELLWGQLIAATYLLEHSFVALLGWVQVAAALLGLVLIWVVYASNVMRFRWVPTTSDSVYPFFIGLLEFLMIESMGPEHFGEWMILMAIMFATMVYVSHATMRRARKDPSNQSFFSTVKPATAKDFLPHVACVSSLLVGGLFLYYSGNTGIIALLLLLMVLGLLLWQYIASAVFWKSSLVE